MILSRLRPLLATLAVAISHAAERPNILVIMADDLGYSDLGCFGGEIRTPHLDQLASNGLQFTRCYNSSRCCPSRASLLTGLTPHQAGIGRFVGNGSKPGYLGRLSDRCVTLAEVSDPSAMTATPPANGTSTTPAPSNADSRNSMDSSTAMPSTRGTHQ